MRFTKAQYEQAIEALRDGMTQLEPDGHCCAICGDGGHMAWTCHHNPLRAMELCHEVYSGATDLHETLHRLIGGDWSSGIFIAVPEDEAKVEALLPRKER